MDTDAEARARHLALIRTVSKAERLRRTLALSAFVRRLAWAGAARRSTRHGPQTPRQRFLAQLYRHELTPELSRLIERL